MPINVRLSNAARITKREPTATTALNLSRSTYQKLGSLVQNKSLSSAYANGELTPEYVRVLDELNDLYLKTSYPMLYGHLVIEPGIVELDAYLGSLGIDEEYPYSKDAVDIPAWIEADSQTEYRILVDERDNTYLTTNNGSEVLVYYTK